MTTISYMLLLLLFLSLCCLGLLYIKLHRKSFLLENSETLRNEESLRLNTKIEELNSKCLLEDQKFKSLEKLNKSIKLELEQLKSNPDGTLKVLNDLANKENVVLSIRRVSPGEMFLRSPRGL